MSCLFLIACTAPGRWTRCNFLQCCPHFTGLDGPFFYVFKVLGPFFERNHRLCSGVNSHAYA